MLLLLLLPLLGPCTAVAETTEAPPRCATTNRDFNGHDILPPFPPKVATAKECCTKCKGNPKCHAFSFALADGTCYLKSAAYAAQAAQQHPGNARLSAWVNASCSCSGPAATAPKCWASPTPCGVQPPPPPSPPHSHPSGPAILKQYSCLLGDNAYPHCDASKSIGERVDTIISNLTATEMVDIIKKGGVGRLGIGSYAMWADESLHGVRLWPERCPFHDRCTTIFPTASTASRAFNSSLWVAIGRAMGTEGRTLWNLGITKDLSLRGPQVNIQRDPRWGRNSNSPSEDPLLTGLYGQALVTGTQTPADGVNLINSQMKHWTGYGVESNRMGFNGNISVHDMSETYMVPLQLMLKANVSSAMCACEFPSYGCGYN